MGKRPPKSKDRNAVEGAPQPIERVISRKHPTNQHEDYRVRNETDNLICEQLGIRIPQPTDHAPREKKDEWPCDASARNDAARTDYDGSNPKQSYSYSRCCRYGPHSPIGDHRHHDKTRPKEKIRARPVRSEA